MPPHPEVPAALRRLRSHGFRLFTLTDNTLEISGRTVPAVGVRNCVNLARSAAARSDYRAVSAVPS